MNLKIISGAFVDNVFITFGEEGSIGHDDSDSEKLLPLEATPRLAAMTVQNATALKINNLPFVYDEVIEVPFTALVLAVDENGNFATQDVKHCLSLTILTCLTILPSTFQITSLIII